ncbi:MAG: UDP-N-acetylglucosamine 1-carboxyvinyltransferase [Clostridia bacterium]|nr:UDP-N-acetylglucosamine 1-carboxyvinyltransferase [Clostridia bacterium]
MIKYVVNGGRELSGSVNISGAKNAAVAIIPASVIVEGVCHIENLPNISDVSLWLDILASLGAKIRPMGPGGVEIDTTNLNRTSPSPELMRKMRASYYLIGALLGRSGRANVAMPGGCDFGDRPIDQHLKGFRALGATVGIANGIVEANSDGPLVGGHVYFDKVSVGATINVMIAAAKAVGMTVIENAAKEPHIVDLANFLNSMGADIRGAGTNVIRIRGVSKLRGGSYTIIPDQIEAGTYIAAVAAAGGDVRINNIIPKHLESITAKFKEMGVKIEENDDSLRVIRHGGMTGTNITTLPYPGFPTDLQPQIAAVLCLSDGMSVITEGVWDNRFRYVEELRRMGAQIQVDGKIAIISSIKGFSGAPVCACDLRAGAALIVAALAASGQTVIDGIIHIERGYEDIVAKLCELGADIRAVDFPSGNPVMVTA